MTVTNIEKDLDALTLTITADFSAPIERVWQLWEDPRLLEQWWGPPMYPATVVEHHLTPGGKVSYYMTGPEGDEHHGWWRVISVDAPRRLELEDGFADAEGNPDDDLPTARMCMTLDTDSSGTTTMVTESIYPTRAAMEEALAMGMEDGIREAMGQMDALL
jgi:uncharacterized protein YndB with AHSA1/START domain